MEVLSSSIVVSTPTPCTPDNEPDNIHEHVNNADIDTVNNDSVNIQGVQSVENITSNNNTTESHVSLHIDIETETETSDHVSPDHGHPVPVPVPASVDEPEPVPASTPVPVHVPDLDKVSPTPAPAVASVTRQLEMSASSSSSLEPDISPLPVVVEVDRKPLMIVQKTEEDDIDDTGIIIELSNGNANREEREPPRNGVGVSSEKPAEKTSNRPDSAEKRVTEKRKDDEDDDYLFITRISTEEFMKAYEEKAEEAFRKTSAALSSSSSVADEAIMNNSQLLAILEGEDHPAPAVPKRKPQRQQRLRVLDSDSEKAIALKQLKEMPSARRKKRDRPPQIMDVKIPKVEIRPKEVPSPSKSPLPSVAQQETVEAPKKTANCSDLSFIMRDWDDEEGEERCDAAIRKDSSVELKSDSNKNEIERDDSNVPTEDGAAPEENGLAPVSRRAQRVIKKKVIFDPDNPDTFNFASATIKKASPTKVTDDHSEPQTTLDTSNNNVESVDRQSEPKDIAKKKKVPVPSLTPSKKKKMTEVDRLLMDEGAVNMIYQVERGNNNSEVPEISLKPNKNSMISISKEKKTLISKAKIIKKAVLNKSSDSSDASKTFRSRKDSKTSDNQSVKVEKIRPDIRSPSISEQIVGDESRIIRRHSSSSFSSGCLSPRPQSPQPDVSASIVPENGDASLMFSDDSFRISNDSAVSSTPGEFLIPAENITIPPKKKGRPRKKLLTNITNETIKLGVLKNYLQITLNIADKAAFIVIKPTGNSKELFDCQVMSEITHAIKAASQANAILLTSSEGGFCTGLDLRKALNSVAEKRKENISKIILSYRTLVMSMYKSKAALIIGIGGNCSGLGVTLLTFTDLAIASDAATFCAAPRHRRQLPPEGSVLLTSSNIIPKQLSRELLLCGRKLTASEALQRGLVARTLWPDRFDEELRSIVSDIANQSNHSFDVIKRVLRYKDSIEVLHALNFECPLLSEFWNSPEGQQAIRETHSDI